MRTRLLVSAIVVGLLALVSVVVRPSREVTLTVAPASTTTIATTTTTATTAPPPPTTAPPPPTTRKPIQASAAPRVTAAPTTLMPAPTLRTNAPLVPGSPGQFRGFGAWIDVYDWSAEFTGGKPSVGPADVDRMAGFGVQTLYVQTAKQASPNDVVDANLLRPIISRARERGLRVIAWYAPSLEDPAKDLRKLLASAALDVDGVGVDIESRAVSDAAERSRRLVDLSIALRQHLPAMPLAAIVMPAVQMEVINPKYWPGFPYREIAPAYDVWMPMSYWTSRTQVSGYRDAYRYTAENIDRLRANVGTNDVAVHPIGGIGDTSNGADIDGFRRAAEERGSIGGSIYDYRTTHDALWDHLKPFRT